MNNFTLSQSLCHNYLFVWEPDINKTLAQTEIRIPYKWKALDGCCHTDLLSPSLSLSIRAFQIGKLHLHQNKNTLSCGFSQWHISHSNDSIVWARQTNSFKLFFFYIQKTLQSSKKKTRNWSLYIRSCMQINQDICAQILDISQKYYRCPKSQKEGCIDSIFSAVITPTW